MTTTVIWLSGSSVLPSRLRFSANGRVHELARKILAAVVIVVCALRSVRYARVCDKHSHRDRPAPGVCSFPCGDSGCCIGLVVTVEDSKSAGLMAEADLVSSFSFLTSLMGRLRVLLSCCRYL